MVLIGSDPIPMAKTESLLVHGIRGACGTEVQEILGRPGEKIIAGDGSSDYRP
jgi:hypothetical protein